MKKRLIRLFQTLRYVKPTQILFQVYYRLRKKIKPIKLIAREVSNEISSLSFTDSIVANSSFDAYSLTFLNKTIKMKKSAIEWDNETHGKLWAYNLNYFEFLHQKEMNEETGLALINEFIDTIETNKNGLEPYPISLRGIFWIKFLSKHSTSDTKIDNSLYSQYQLLMQQLEYHLLGNHLLENGFTLLFGGVYFADAKLLKKASKILTAELKEQILDDGAHFELSPMYHQIILYRVLDSINLLQNNANDNPLLPLLKEKAIAMLGWLQTVTFTDGSIPMVNDSAYGIAPTSEELFSYAERLNIAWEKIALNSSGYRKFQNDTFELFIDAGNIGPDYIPGHAHSDIGNFILNVDGKPLITEVGTSTYEKNSLRTSERATRAHNTVIVNGTEQIDVWGGFRVGKRAKVISLIEKNNEVSVSHNGYRELKITHSRNFQVSDKRITIKDTLSNLNNAVALLHFTPNTKVTIQKNQLIVGNITITLSGHSDILLTSYQVATGFNKLQEALLVEIHFEKELTTEISIEV